MNDANRKIMHPLTRTTVSAPRGRLALQIATFMVVAIATVAGFSTTAANADTADDDFVNNLAAQGITVPRAQLIPAGHMICSTVSASSAGIHVPARLARLLPLSYATTALGMPADQAATVVDAALNTYCPQYLPQ